MANILLKNKLTTQTNVLVITTKFINEFNLPDKVNDYIVAELKKEGICFFIATSISKRNSSYNKNRNN